MSHSVTDAPAHGKPWRVDILDPDPLWAREASSPILGLHDLAATIDDPRLLFGIVRLVVRGKLLDSHLLLFINRYHYGPRVSTIDREKLVSAEKGSCESRPRELHIENIVGLLLVLRLDHRIVKGIGNNLFFSLLLYVVILLILLLWLRLDLDLGLLLLPALTNELLDVLRELDLQKETALGSVLAMAIADRKEVLMECLAHIRSQYKIILILLVGVVDAEALTRRVRKSCDYIVFNDFGALVRFVLLYAKWAVRGVLNPIMVVDSLIGETSRLRDHTASDQALNGTVQWIRRVELVLNHR